MQPSHSAQNKASAVQDGSGGCLDRTRPACGRRLGLEARRTRGALNATCAAWSFCAPPSLAVAALPFKVATPCGINSRLLQWIRSRFADSRAAALAPGGTLESLGQVALPPWGGPARHSGFLHGCGLALARETRIASLCVVVGRDVVGCSADVGTCARDAFPCSAAGRVICAIPARRVQYQHSELNISYAG